MRTPGHDRELATGFLLGEGLITAFDQIESVHPAGPRFGPGPLDQFRPRRLPPRSPPRSRPPRAQFLHDLQLRRLRQSLARHPRAPAPAARSTLRPPSRSPPSSAICPTASAWPKPSSSAPAACTPSASSPRTANPSACARTSGATTPWTRSSAPSFSPVIPSPPTPSSSSAAAPALSSCKRPLAARIAIFVSVGAPSSLAADLAERAGATLVGFVKPDSFNIYTGAQRIAARAPQPAAL